MKWFYQWKYNQHLKISCKYQHPKYETLFNIHIEKMRYYAAKLREM